jgi:DNA-binding Lrp family transcriptional regulator
MSVTTKEISLLQARILKKLLIDGRKSTTEISAEIGETKETVNKQFQEMKNLGIIKGATVHINYKAFGYKAVATLLIDADPQQTEMLIEHVKKLPDIYAVYKQGPRGNIHVVATLRTLQQLDQVKDEIKRQFTVSSMKTVIWTNVREMNGNLSLAPEEKELSNLKTKGVESKSQEVSSKDIKMDEIDLKIADLLSQNGRLLAGKIAKEIGISSNDVKERIAALKQTGKLKVTIQIDPIRIGYLAMAVFYTSALPEEDPALIVDEVSRIPDVISIMKTSGDYDLQIFAMVRDIDNLLSIQEKIAKIRGIAKMDMEISRCLSKWPTPRQYMSTF